VYRPEGTNVRRANPTGLVSLLLVVALLAFGGALSGTTRAAAAASGGYWLVDSDGSVYDFAGAPRLTVPPRSSTAPVVGMAATPDGLGYWLADTNGKVTAVGSAPGLGSASGVGNVVAMAATPSGKGYWLATATGHILPFGDAGAHGSMAGVPLNKPVVGMAATPSGRGYWLVATDGGIFAFGDAPFRGSTGHIQLNKPIVGMAATRTGAGYWMVAADGGIFAFDAPFYGSTGAQSLSRPIVTMQRTPDGDGYWLTDTRGKIFRFGSAVVAGDASGCSLPAPVVGMAASGPGTISPAPSPKPNCGIVQSASAFDVGLIGDTGYDSAQDAILLKVRAQMATLPLGFVAHNGDTHMGGKYCNSTRDAYTYDVFNGFASPFIYTPGDNEWRDCSNPLARLDALRSRFFSTSRSLGKTTIPLTRQSSPYVENARWSKGNVIFATLNVPGPRSNSPSASETSARSKANVAWLNAAFDEAAAARSPAVMIIWQDNPFDGSADSALVSTLKSRTAALGRPVALVHGDTHKYRIDHPWSSLPNFTRVETYAGTQSNKWVRATIDPSSAKVFSFTTMTS
jgi:hypothetical protein